MKRFVLSNKAYPSIRETERILTNRITSGENLSNLKVFQVVETYGLKVKLVKLTSKAGR